MRRNLLQVWFIGPRERARKRRRRERDGEPRARAGKSLTLRRKKKRRRRRRRRRRRMRREGKRERERGRQLENAATLRVYIPTYSMLCSRAPVPVQPPARAPAPGISGASRVFHPALYISRFLLAHTRRRSTTSIRRRRRRAY